MENMCAFRLENGNFTVGNALFEQSFSGVKSVTERICDANGLSEPFIEYTAMATDGSQRRFCVWEDLPLVYLPNCREENLLTLDGEHWIVRCIKLHAFTDENDTLTEETVVHLFQRRLKPRTGDIFLLEDPESRRGVVLISETPDFQTATLRIRNGVVSVENGGNGLVLGFCAMGECEALCRNYYRHARKCKSLISMSNTWGDRNGFKRVGRDFILREIDAARQIGVDIVQIDDGWQVGSTADPTRRNALGRREFKDDFWELSEERFPDGMKSVVDYAAKDGIQVGLWFAPESQDCFACLERDKAILHRAYTEWGIRFFKLDMFWIESDTDRDRFLELLRGIYSFGDDVSVQLDVTRNARMNYFCGREFGTVFVENRYHASGNSYPHRILRNLWMLGTYLPTNKFQFEMINPDLFIECYPENDPFAPVHYSQDYLFASVMFANPLFWQEMQFLSQKRRDELVPLMQIWKEHRDFLAGADIAPIGEKPGGRSFTGFCASVQGSPRYLLLFREVTEKDSAVLTAPVCGEKPEILYSNTEASVRVEENTLQVTLKNPRSYVFVKLQ